MDLSPFSAIDPCGYPGLPVTQLKDLGFSESPQETSTRLAGHVIRNLEDA
jgi:lipoyl(octanoyl) transferase